MAYAIALTLAVYTAAGMLFAAAFVIHGAGRVDPNVQGAPWTFHLIIAPGAVALWPLLLFHWLRQEEGEP
jgi:hypothetical protein